MFHCQDLNPTAPSRMYKDVLGSLSVSKGTKAGQLSIRDGLLFGVVHPDR